MHIETFLHFLRQFLFYVNLILRQSYLRQFNRDSLSNFHELTKRMPMNMHRYDSHLRQICQSCHISCNFPASNWQYSDVGEIFMIEFLTNFLLLRCRTGQIFSRGVDAIGEASISDVIPSNRPKFHWLIDGVLHRDYISKCSENTFVH